MCALITWFVGQSQVARKPTNAQLGDLLIQHFSSVLEAATKQSSAITQLGGLPGDAALKRLQSASLLGVAMPQLVAGVEAIPSIDMVRAL